MICGRLAPLERIKASERALQEAFTPSERTELAYAERYAASLLAQVPEEIERICDTWLTVTPQDALFMLQWYRQRPLTEAEVRKSKRLRSALEDYREERPHISDGEIWRLLALPEPSPLEVRRLSDLAEALLYGW